jgi:hypothetical protein
VRDAGRVAWWDAGTGAPHEQTFFADRLGPERLHPGGGRHRAGPGVEALDPASCSTCRSAGSIPVAPIFSLTMVWNRGVSFGLMQAEVDWVRWSLVLFSAAVSVALAVWAWRVTRAWLGLALGTGDRRARWAT